MAHIQPVYTIEIETCIENSLLIVMLNVTLIKYTNIYD